MAILDLAKLGKQFGRGILRLTPGRRLDALDVPEVETDEAPVEMPREQGSPLDRFDPTFFEPGSYAPSYSAYQRLVAQAAPFDLANAGSSQWPPGAEPESPGAGVSDRFDATQFDPNLYAPSGSSADLWNARRTSAPQVELPSPSPFLPAGSQHWMQQPVQFPNPGGLPDSMRHLMEVPRRTRQALPDTELPSWTGNALERVLGVESSGDPNAKNKKSSATGLGQFLDDTWLEKIDRYRPDLKAGLTRQQILELRKNPGYSREMTRHYMIENIAGLRNDRDREGGLPVRPGTAYLAHFLGLGGAKTVLKADPNEPATSLLPKHVIDANDFLRKMSAGQVIAWADAKMKGVDSTWPRRVAPLAHPDLYPGADMSPSASGAAAP